MALCSVSCFLFLSVSIGVILVSLRPPFGPLSCTLVSLRDFSHLLAPVLCAPQDADGCPASLHRGPGERGGWQEDAHTDVVHSVIDALVALGL